MVTHLNTNILTRKTTTDLKETSAKIRSVMVKSTQLASNANDLVAKLNLETEFSGNFCTMNPCAVI
jgi:hypothetical protein